MSNSLKQKLHGKTVKFFGPPGTGKTHRLLERVKRFLKRGISPDEICYISFTNKAIEARLLVLDAPGWKEGDSFKPPEQNCR